MDGDRADGRRERWRAHRENRRLELISAVIEAVETRGAGVGMEDIAAASGIAKPIFYRYFSDKADLFLAVGRAVAEQVVTEVARIVEQEPDARARLAAGIRAYLRAIEAQPEVYRFVVHRPSLERTVDEDPASDFATVLGLRVTRLLHDQLRGAGLDSGAAEPWGFGLVGLVRAAADRWIETRSMSSAALADYLTELLWSGLARVVPPPAD